MSFFDDASLVTIPSGIKDGVVYSVKPIDGSGDLTFSRGSDIEATRVNANGYIEKAQVNLALQSNTFSTTWTTANTVATSGQSGYDGTNDAWKLEKFAASGNLQQAVTQSGVCTLSFYAKAGNLNWTRIIASGGSSTPSTWFDLQNGVVGAADFFTIDSNITSVGGGWYRCSITFEVGSYTGIRIYPADANNDVSGTSGYIYIQDAQLNYGLVAQTYQETTTAAVVSGITDDMPRLNYDPANPTCPSLLLEPSRQNLFPHSDLLTAWSQDSATTTANQTTSPEGVVNGSLITATGATSIDHTIYQNILSLSAGTYTASAYVKKNTQRYVHLTFNRQADSNEWAVANFDLDSGTSTNHSNILATPTSTITAVGSDWYRITLTAALTTAGNTFCFLGFSESGAPNTSRGRYAIISSDSFYAYGLQCELGNYESSLIPTYGSSATRTADACSKTGISSLIGQTEGTIYIEAEYIDGVGDSRVSLSDGSSSNWIFIGAPEPTGGNIKMRMYINNGGVNQVNKFSSTIVTKGVHKYALAYKANDVVMYLDGNNEGSDTLSTIPACNQLTITGGGATTPNAQISTGIKQVIIFPTRLTNAQLAELTTL